MIFDLTNENKQITSEINRLVGEPFSMLTRLKKGGIGSEKMEIVEASPLMEGLLQFENQPNFCNVELRPRGVMIYFSYRIQVYVWVIPYAKLSVYRSSEYYRIYGEAEFIKVTKVFNGNALKLFMDKLLDHRALYLDSISGPGSW